jgi:hypothetical protein
MDETQQMSALSDGFAQLDMGGGPVIQQHLLLQEEEEQQPTAEAEPLLVGTSVKKDTIRFEHAGRRFKTSRDQWLQLSTGDGAVYMQFTNPSSGQSYWTWGFGLSLESQLAGHQGLGNQTSGVQGSGSSGGKGGKKSKGKGKAPKDGGGNARKK